MNAAPATLTIDNLTVALPYGLDRENAVTDFSLTVKRREIVCVVGESGSGKSVTAASVMGLLPSALKVRGGTIRLEGEDITNAGEARLCELRGNRMAMIFQEPLTALSPVMKVGDQIAEVLRLHTDLGRKAVQERVIALMADVHLPDPGSMRHVYPHQISGGQRQRVMIAMALAMEPALIIADEPTTALDVTTQAQILRLFRELQTKHDSGILMITHDFGVVADIADHVVVMKEGRIVESGKPDRILSNPQDAYTRALIDAVPDFRFVTRKIGADAPVLQADGLNLTYRKTRLFHRKSEVRAVQDVDFTLGRAETLGIVGESGSGKSSLAKAILGFESLDSGRLLLNGQDLLTMSTREFRNHRHRMQMIFQDPYKSLNPRRRIANSLTEGPIRHGVASADAMARARELMALVGLSPDVLDRYPHEFSGGQRQRVCIARALALEPEIIVADEAVSALDVTVQAQVLDLFAELQSRLGFSMIFITHDLRVASNVCDRIAVMKTGRIVESGQTREVFENPQHAYTRELLGAVPGNWAFSPALSATGA